MRNHGILGVPSSPCPRSCNISSLLLYNLPLMSAAARVCRKQPRIHKLHTFDRDGF